MIIQGFTPNESVFETLTETGKSSSVSFGDVMKNALDSVNEQQIYADELTNELVLGGDVEVHEVMLASEEAKLSLQLAVQIRNSLTEAVKELTSLQL